MALGPPEGSKAIRLNQWSLNFLSRILKKIFYADSPLYIFQLTSMIHHKFKQLQRM